MRPDWFRDPARSAEGLSKASQRNVGNEDLLNDAKQYDQKDRSV